MHVAVEGTYESQCDPPNHRKEWEGRGEGEVGCVRGRDEGECGRVLESV